MAKLFPELGQEVTETVEAPHLQLAFEQSDATGFPGTRITLAVEVRLPPDVHVYAPGTNGHKPIKLLLDPIRQLSKTLYLRAVKEQMPVFKRSVHISQDIQVVTGAEFWVRLAKAGNFHDHRKSSSIRRATRSRAMC